MITRQWSQGGIWISCLYARVISDLFALPKNLVIKERSGETAVVLVYRQEVDICGFLQLVYMQYMHWFICSICIISSSFLFIRPLIIPPWTVVQQHSWQQSLLESVEVWQGLAWQDCIAGHSSAQQSIAWSSIAWSSTAWSSMAWLSLAWHSIAWCTIVWRSIAWPSTGWRGMAWFGIWVIRSDVLLY